MVTSAVQQKTVSSSRSEQLPFALWRYFAADEIEAVGVVLRSGKVNYRTGQEGKQFEAEFAHFVDAKYRICLANGTVAMEAALNAFRIGPGDEVIRTLGIFIGSASCLVLRRAQPVLDEWESIYRSFTQGPAQLAYSEGGAS